MPGNGYASFTGTSMASPHVAATVALIWSASPALQGDIAATEAAARQTAIDVDDTSCGGTAADNNVWGEGRLDAFAAVQAAPRGGLGELKGTVTAGGSPVAGATVSLSGPLSRTAITGADGTYAVPRLLPGDYQIAAAKFGYDQGTATATIAADQSSTADVVDDPAGLGRGVRHGHHGGHAGAGRHRSRRSARPSARSPTPRAVTGFTLPNGDLRAHVTPVSRCASGATASVTVAGDVTKDIELPLRGDNFGYTCRSAAEPYVAGTDKLALTGDDEAQQVTLPFPVPFYGEGQSRAWISTNGFATFAADQVASGGNGRCPAPARPTRRSTRTGTTWCWTTRQRRLHRRHRDRAAPPFVIEWRNARFYSAADQRISFSALLGEDGSIGLPLQGIDSERDQGTSATVGHRERGRAPTRCSTPPTSAALANGQSLTFIASRHGLVTGTVTDANDGKPLAGATVKVGDVATFTTGEDGTFFGQVLAGDYEVEVSKENYGTFTKTSPSPPERRSPGRHRADHRPGRPPRSAS